jgi:3-hydroxybutyryl-CoA dehydratase
MKLNVGDSASITKTITDDDIRRFADLVGDVNPVHLDDEIAKKTRFGRRVAHGMWGASLISAVLGTRLPGPGTVYLSQTMKFQAPIFLGDTVTAKVAVTKVRDDKPIVTLETVCENQEGKTLLQGEAVVLVEEIG